MLGFPIAYTTTLTGDDGKAVVSTMEVTEFEATTLDPALFEIPGGFNAVSEHPRPVEGAERRERSEAGGGQRRAARWRRRPKQQGSCALLFLSSLTRHSRPWNTRALRQRLISDLAEAKFEAVPMPAATPAESQRSAPVRWVLTSCCLRS